MYRDSKILIEDILESIEKINLYVEGLSFDDFNLDSKTIDAVTRNFEIIGEASNKIPEEFKINYPDIEWKKIIGLRNRIIHEYFGVDNSIIWFIIENELELLKEKLVKILQ